MSYTKKHEGCGFGEMNEAGERVFYFASAYD